VTPLRTVIVDDEEPARELLRALLAAWPDVEVVGEAGDGAEALAMIARLAPDLAFLDVQMPEMSGIDVAQALSRREAPPAVVFVTAYDQYAVKAFEVSALDYLLKPFDADRLAAALARVRGRRSGADPAVLATVQALLARARPPAGEPIVVKADGKHVFLGPNEIEWIEAVGKEVRVHLGATALLVRESMNGIETRLDRARFVRVHRSALVNRAHIREVQPWFKGDYVVILRRGTRILTGRTFRAAVQALLRGAAPGDALLAPADDR
jgi:two-component system, LytTR family, response regulator